MEKSWKVKLYKLNGDGDWIDLGIGYLEFNGKQVNIKKENEETQLILSYEVRDEDYHTQGETILTWVGEDLSTFALSFIERSSVKEVLEEVCRIQNRKLNDVKGEEELGCWAEEVSKENLQVFLEEIIVGGKWKVESEVLKIGFMSKLGKVFREIEKGDKARLHLVFLIYKQLSNLYLVHLNSIKILEALINDEFNTLLEALKYDPCLDDVEFDLITLYSSSSFINILNIQDEITLKKIERINKLLFIKDTALARHLDDPANTFIFIELQNSLKDLITIYNKDTNLRRSLYEKIENKDPIALKFLMDICSASKLCTIQERHCLFDTFFHDGILNVVEKNSRDADSSGYLEFVGELFCSVINVSPFIIRNLFFNGNDQLGCQFLKHIAQQLVKSSDIGVIQDLGKLFNSVLDPDSRIFETIRPIFYNEIFPILINCIKQESHTENLSEVLEIFSVCIEKHSDKSDLLKILVEFTQRIPILISSNKHITVQTLKLIKAVITKNEKFLNLFILRKKVFDTVLSVLESNSKQENLLFSVSLSTCFKVINSTIFSQLSKPISDCLKRIGLESLAVQFVETKKSLLFNKL